MEQTCTLSRPFNTKSCANVAVPHYLLSVALLHDGMDAEVDHRRTKRTELTMHTHRSVPNGSNFMWTSAKLPWVGTLRSRTTHTAYRQQVLAVGGE